MPITGDITPPKDGAWPPWGASVRPAVIAFDIGAKMGWAALSEARGFVCGTIDRELSHLDEEWTRQVRARLIWSTQELAGDELLVVAVEDVFFGKNIAVLAHLARYGGAIITLASQLGLPSVRVYPHSWQTALLGKVPRAQGKAMSLARARATFGADRIASDHEADASMLALYTRGALPRGISKGPNRHG
jgi:Holliday junction resolvasome RuvABC endonuclease subunit